MATSTIQGELTALETVSTAELRERWRRTFRAPPPALSRDLLLRGLAYRLQEQAEGGLGKVTLRRLRAAAEELAATGTIEPPPILRPGTRLVREWHGRTHTVTVAETGFDYAGTTYRSLSEIARKITGAHWSGPRFFGLTKKRSEASHG